MVVVVGPSHHLYSASFESGSGPCSFHPCSETGQCGCYGRHSEGYAFQWSVAPGFIVACENGAVECREEAVVVLVEDSVATVEIAWNVEHAHAGVAIVGETCFMYAAVHRIIVVVVQTMGYVRVVETPVFTHGQGMCQVGAQAGSPSGNHHQGKHPATGALRFLQECESVDENIETLVAVFETPRCSDNECVVVEMASRESFRHLEYALAGFAAAFGVFCFCGYEFGLESVRRHHIWLAAKELGCFGGGYVAHCSEAVGIPCCRFLQRVLAFHVQLLGHLVAVVVGELVVQRFAVSADTPSDACGMGCEHSGHLRHVGLDSQKTHCCCPFVEMCYHRRRIFLRISYYAFNNQGGCAGEGTAFVVVSVGVQRIHLEEIPHAAVGHVFVGIHAVEFHQNRQRFSGDVPPAHTHVDAFGEHGPRHP